MVAPREIHSFRVSSEPRIADRILSSYESLIGRQREMEGNTRPGIFVEPQLSAQRFNNASTDRQSHSHPLFLGAKKGVKN